MTELLARFVAAFRRGIEGEMAAVQASATLSEVALARGEDLGGLRYAFDVPTTADLAPGTSGTVRTARGQHGVTIERVDKTRLTLLATTPVDLAATPITLVLAPWFLYERLLEALGALDATRHAAGLTRALTLFGKLPHARTTTVLRADHARLDAEPARAAVQLCSDSDLAFVWGPPGTGKTMTLANVIEELLAQGQRILLASTTNAAIVQVLAKLAPRAWFSSSVEAGTAIRLGRSDADTFGAELADIVERLRHEHREEQGKLRLRIGEIDQQLRHARILLDTLGVALAPQQSLFGESGGGLGAGALGHLSSPGLANVLARRPPSDQRRVIERRVARLERVRVLAKARIAGGAAADRALEARLVTDARAS